MRKRILILPAAAVVIAALCAYRILKDEADHSPPPLPPVGNHRAVSEQEMFDLADENGINVRLKAFIGRHQILLAFFDGKRGVDQDPIVARLRQDYEKIAATDTKIFAISEAIPQQNRKIIEKAGRYPFPVLSDPARRAIEAWAIPHGSETQPTSMLFFINRAGNVDHGETAPRPVKDPQAFIDSLIDNK